MTGLAPEVVKLLDLVLDSYEKVEVAWQLASTGTSSTVEELRARVQLDRETMQATLNALSTSGVVVVNTVDGVASVSLGRRARSPDFEALMRLRATDHIAVMSTLMTLSIRRVRSMAARTFADAFLLRPKKPDGSS